MAASGLGELVLKFSADISDILTGVEKMQSELADFSSGVSGAFGDLKGAISDVADALIALAAADYFGKLVAGAIDAGAELQRLSESTGFSVQELSAFKNAMAETGESSDNSSRQLQTFERNIETATSGTGKAADALNALGLSATKLAQETPDQQLQDFATALSGVNDGAGKTAVTMALMGRGGAALIPTLEILAENGTTLATVSESAAANSLALEAAWGQVKVQGSGLVSLITSQFTPYMTSLVKAFLDVGSNAGSFGNTLKGLAGEGTFATWAYNIGLYIAQLADKLVDAKNWVIAFGQGIGVSLGVLRDFGTLLSGVGTILAGLIEWNPAKVQQGWSQITGAVSNAISEVKDFANQASAPPSEVFVDAYKLQVTDFFNSTKAAEEGGVDVHIQSSAAKKTADNEYFAWYKNQLTSILNDAKANDAQLSAAATSLANEQIAAAKQALAEHQITQAQELADVVQIKQQEGAALVQYAQQNVTAAKDVLDAWKAQADADVGNKNLEQKDLDQVTAATKEWNNEIKALATVQDNANKANSAALLAQTNQYDKEQQQIQKVTDTFTKWEEELQKTSDEQAFQNSLIGKSADEVALLTTAYNAQQTVIQEVEALQKAANDALIAGNQEVYDSYIAQINLVQNTLGPTFVNQMTAMKQAALDASNSFAVGWTNAFNQYEQGVKGASLAQDAFNGLTEAMQNLFVGFASNATNAFKQFGTAVLGIIEQIAAKLATSGILNLLSGNGLSLNGLGGGGIGGGSGILGNLGSLGNSISSAVGGGLSDTFSGLFTSGGFLGGSSTLEEFATGATAASDAFAGLAGTIGAAVPYVGIAIAAFGLLSSLGVFGSKGGPKQGGSAETGGGAIFNNLYGGTGTSGDTGRAYTPNQDDAQFTTLSADTLTAYNAFNKALGGAATNVANFLIAGDSDPQGTAGNRVTAGAEVNGQEVFGVKDLGVGSTDLGTATSLEAQRALLSALQASDLPPAITKILDSVNAATATADSITNVLNLATAMGGLYTSISGLNDPVKTASEAVQNSLTPTISGIATVGAALQTAETNFDGSTTAIQNLSAATANYQQAMEQAQQQIDGMKTSINSLTDDAIKKFTLSTLDSSQQLQYYQNDAKNAQAALLKATDPTQVANLTQQIQDDLNSEWQLLTPDQQKQQLASFTAAEDTLNKTANDQLSKISTTLENQYNTAIAGIKTTLDTFVGNMSDAATTQQTAANTNLAAAQTPTTVNVNLTDNGTTVATFSGS